MLPRCSHVGRHFTRKRGVFYYRRRFPGDWEREITLSLQTTDFREAEYRAEKLDEKFSSLSPAMLANTNLRSVLQTYLDELLEGDLRQRLDAKPGKPVYTFGTPDQNAVEADLDTIGTLLVSARERLANRDLHSVSEDVERLAQEHQLSDDDRKLLALGVLGAQVRFYETLKDRALGRTDGLGRSVDGLLPNAVPSDPKPGPNFSKFAKEYVSFGVGEKGWRQQTKSQNETTYSLFAEVCGDRPINRYTRQDTGTFYETLRKLPAMYGKAAEWKGKTTQEIAADSEGSDIPRLTMKTIKRHFTALGGLFAHAKSLGHYAGENPAHGFTFPSKGRPKATRAIWEGEKLRLLFASPVWAGCDHWRRSKPGPHIIRDDKFWLPLLGLYHGNRLEEFAQLKREDIQQKDDIWFFDITDGEGRQLKNVQSKRRVPIHSEVIKIGFLQYISGLSPDPKGQVFPELKSGGADKKFGHAFTKWWTRYRKDIGLYEPKLDYHSFRHGVTTKLYGANVSPVIVDELTGHEGKGTGQTVYHHGASLEALHEAISKVSYAELDLSHLYVNAAPAQEVTQ